ncbi:SRPBCC domain-containing protein [soil metagenome]
MAKKSTRPAPHEDLNLVLTRVFDATPQDVFEAWTDRDQLMRWHCPKNFKVIFCDADVRVGGKWRLGMRGPDGREYISGGVYKQVKAPGKLVFTHSWEHNEQEPASVNTLITLTFVETGAKTTMTFVQAGLTTPESRNSHKGGWSEAFDNLIAYIGPA